jgi:hypothetical protein
MGWGTGETVLKAIELGGQSMAESEGLSVEQFGTLAERAGLTMTIEELTALKPMFDYYAKQIKLLFEIELDAEDLAVVYSPNWDPQG